MTTTVPPARRTGPAARWRHRRLARSPLGLLAWGVLALFVLVLVAGPWVVPVDPLAQDSEALLPWGSAGHLLGTDELGRDVLSRVLTGGRPLLVVSIGSAVAAAALGTVLGLLAGYCGGVVDSLVMRVVDVLLAFPLVLVAILMVAVLGGGTTNTLIAITVSQVPFCARLVRNLTLAQVNLDYVRSARALGTAGPVIAVREVLPNLVGPLLVNTTSSLAVTAGLSSALSYLGLGQDASSPDWGYMVRSGQELIFSNPSLALLPGLLITVFAVAANLAGDDLRDAVDTGGAA
ncbi:ABC transporter permease [Kineococcus sp. SYSU DK003]|uniref:ABC transporter permease n=1 Tax=Kineococcus sp. SYSU DK003 TaxID=3383124 RepID=UPI003D7C8EEE